jgi:Tol biopolymer transport system component
LTDAPGGVWDFSVSPDGDQIAYTVLSENSTSDLWLLRRSGAGPEYLLDCPEAACNSPAWSPDGRFLALTRRSAGTLSTTGGLSPPRIWLINMETGETAQLFPDGQTLGFNPLWSASGQWISYLSPDLNGVGLYNVNDGRQRFIETGTGELGIWHPQADLLLVSILRQSGDQYRMHLYRADPLNADSGIDSMINLSGEDAAVDDSSPAWSPDGAWIAFRRKELEGERASLGKQLWVMRADGSAARPLTIAPEFDHGQPVWSPDGRYLLYHRFPLKGPNIVLSIWLLDVETGAARELVSPGQRPLWLP